MEALRAAGFEIIKLARYLPWTLEIEYWILDIRFMAPEGGVRMPLLDPMA